MVDWDGGLTLSEGKITDVSEFGFDHPDGGITERTPTTLRWNATTTGGYKGVRLAIDALAEASVDVRTTPVTRSFSLGAVEERIDGGGLDVALTVRRTGTATNPDIDATLTDGEDVSGLQPYYVRVHQDDGNMVWSSPIFVSRW